MKFINMTTYSKVSFQPIKPKEDKINIKDISHALSLMCRGNGHLNHFYSVAQHSVNCCKEAKMRGYSNKVQLICLLHDASEAYLADIIRPVKPHLENYLEIEERLQTVIYKKFIKEEVTKEELLKMKEIDDEVLFWELYTLMDDENFKEKKVSDIIDTNLKSFEEIETEFLNLFNELILE